MVSPGQRTVVEDRAQLAEFLAGDVVVMQVGRQLAAGVAVVLVETPSSVSCLIFETSKIS